MHYSGGQKLLYPFVTFSSLGYVIHIVSIYFSGDRNWIHYILTPMKELVLGGSIGGNDVLWFLTSLFLVQVLFNEMTMKNIKAPYVAIGGIIIAYLCHFLHIDKPAYLANVALGISMYSLGFMWKESQFTASSMSIATIIYISIMLIHPSHIDLRTNVLYGNGIFLLAIAFSISGCICLQTYPQNSNSPLYWKGINGILCNSYVDFRITSFKTLEYLWRNSVCHYVYILLDISTSY